MMKYQFLGVIVKEKFIQGILSQFLHERQEKLSKRNQSLTKSLPNILKHIKELNFIAEHDGSIFFYFFSDQAGLPAIPLKPHEVPRVCLYRAGTSPTLEDLHEAKSKYLIKLPHDSIKLLDLAHPSADESLEQTAEYMVQNRLTESKDEAVFAAAKEMGFDGVYSSASKFPGKVVFFKELPVHKEIPKPKDPKEIREWTEASH